MSACRVPGLGTAQDANSTVFLSIPIGNAIGFGLDGSVMVARSLEFGLEGRFGFFQTTTASSDSGKVPDSVR